MSLTTYGEISSITQKLFIPKLRDNIFNSNALFQRAKKKWYRKVDGGEKIVVPLLYATTTSVGRYLGSDQLDTTANNQITAAEFDWTQYYANITITRLDELKNMGKSQIVNFVKAKVQAAEKSLSSIMGTDLFGDGSTAKAFDGLALIAAVTGTYGDIAKATYSWWQGDHDSTTTALTIPVLRGAIGDITIDGDGPTCIATTQDIYDDLYGLIQPSQRFAEKDTANAGFTNILFEGKPVIVDSHCTASYMHLINENYLEFIVHKDEDFRFEPFIKPTNQNVSTSKIYWAGALTCSNCRMQGLMSALA